MFMETFIRSASSSYYRRNKETRDSCFGIGRTEKLYGI